MLVINRDGMIMLINEAATRMLGLNRRVVLGRPIDEFVDFPGYIYEAVSRRDRLTDVEVNIDLRVSGMEQKSINCIISLDYVLIDSQNQASEMRWVIAKIRQEQEIRELVQQQVGAQAPLTLEDIPGESAAIKRVHRFVKVSAPAQASILIRGESGTGKNVLASAIHNASPRHGGPFLIVGCTSIPHEWVVSELLGFDDSLDPKKPGGRPSKFELARGGSIFFQNIDDLPLEAQSILLNVLDLGIVQRLGSDRPIDIDVRIIASSSANIEKLIAQGNFRADLYYRLSAFEITLPALRDHLEDIPVLVERILSRLTRQLERPVVLESGVMDALLRYGWPGNVRELESVLSRAAVQSGGSGAVGLMALPSYIQTPDESPADPPRLKVEPIYRVERALILQAAQVCKGNVSEMAKMLGIGRTTVWRRLKEMDIELTEYRYGNSS